MYEEYEENVEFIDQKEKKKIEGKKLTENGCSNAVHMQIDA